MIQENRYLDYQGDTRAFGRVHRIFYEYDKRNRLVKVKDSGGAAVEYRYDAFNRKYRRKNGFLKGSIKY